MAAPPSRMSRLGNPGAPFRFKRGDQVAWKRFDGSLDFEFAGEVVDAVCEHQPMTGFHKSAYIVRRSDGSYFPADHLGLVRLSAVDGHGSSRLKPGHPKE